MPEITTPMLGLIVLFVSLSTTYFLSLYRIIRAHRRPIGLGAIVVTLHWSVTAWRIAAVSTLFLIASLALGALRAVMFG